MVICTLVTEEKQYIMCSVGDTEPSDDAMVVPIQNSICRLNSKPSSIMVIADLAIDARTAGLPCRDVVKTYVGLRLKVMPSISICVVWFPMTASRSEVVATAFNLRSFQQEFAQRINDVVDRFRDIKCKFEYKQVMMRVTLKGRASLQDLQDAVEQGVLGSKHGVSFSDPSRRFRILYEVPGVSSSSPCTIRITNDELLARVIDIYMRTSMLSCLDGVEKPASATCLRL